MLGRLRPRGAAGGSAGNRLNWWGNARCAAPPPASVASAQRCSRRAVPARTDTSRRRTCRFRPTFVGVMRWRKKDPPELAMRCRLAIEQVSHGPLTDLIAILPELLGQFPGALAGPPQGRHGIAAGGRVHEQFESGEQGRILFDESFPPGPRTATPLHG